MQSFCCAICFSNVAMLLCFCIAPALREVRLPVPLKCPIFEIWMKTKFIRILAYQDLCYPEQNAVSNEFLKFFVLFCAVTIKDKLSNTCYENGLWLVSRFQKVLDNER